MRITWHGDLAEERVHAAAIEAVRDATEFLLEEANRTVPIEEHTLEASGAASVDASVPRGAVSYNTPYARRQHEELSWRHDPGRRAKWLERTFLEQQRRVLGFFASRLRGAFR